MINENYFTTKLDFIVNRSFELKTLYRSFYILDKNTAIKLVSENFDIRNDKEKHIINTFKYHVNKIVSPVFENQILLAQFIYGISISIINAIMSGDYYSKYFFKRVIDLLCLQLNFETHKTLTISEYNKSKVLLEEYFITKSTSGLFTVESLTMEPEILELHKRVYLNALLLTFDKCAETEKFQFNLELNVVKCYEAELTKKTQKEISESNCFNLSDEKDNEEYENYYKSDSCDYDNVMNSPYYNDNLDMDQQSLEFWNNL
ncbi:MAG: hypothetical protein ACOYMA_15490 [Bacteroidia bacterium]